MGPFWSIVSRRSPGLPFDHMVNAKAGVMQPKVRPLRVGFILTKNFTLTALASFVDVLRLAADEGDNSRPIRCQWHIMADTDEPIRSSCGLLMYPNSRFLDPRELDYVVVVGGLLHQGPQIDDKIKRYLLEAANTKVDLIGVCTGSFVLWRLGLLNQKKCCISWYHYRDFLEEFGETLPVADQLFVIDGNRITCSGGMGVAYLAAHIVEQRMGLSSAQKALHIMLIDRMKPGSSAQSAPLTEFAETDGRISRALLMMEQNLSAPLSVARLAGKVSLSTRQLERLFKEETGQSPQATYLRLRLKHARWMLKTDLSLAAIAAETGFVDGSHLSKAFKAAFNTNPSEERRRIIGQSHGQDAGEGRRIFSPA
ncbi:transcriptional regulator GlxA family with amidase domain [Tardiphaga robiniae]|uniref:GlxA family transcriptional regulator n=1 Tax=Tardiphaga robiniae TaxID=943830 RepID=UPI002855F2BB|nr:GlxA family transcriptional regulator [Tardiphaga robiniae]MDR6657779.1 transcriptional regulator GlxA family with amidase domain [Tardiphaga robiniae]